MHFECSPELATLRFDHGKANEIGTQQLDQLAEVLDCVSTQRPAVLLSYAQGQSARGTPLFCAGAHLDERRDWSAQRIDAHVSRQRALVLAFSQLELFHLVVVDGVCLGFGVEWLLAAHYVIATPQAVFGLPELSLGIIPGATGSASLALRVGFAQARRLATSGERIDAQEAVRLGLCQEWAADFEAAMGRARALATAVSHSDARARLAFLSMQRQLEQLNAPQRLALEAHAYRYCLGLENTPTPTARQASSAAPSLTEFVPPVDATPCVEGKRICGHIEAIDELGTLLTNIPCQMLPQAFVLRDAGGRALASALYRGYSDLAAGAFVALCSRAGRLELAVHQGSAAEKSGLQRGDPLFVDEE